MPSYRKNKHPSITWDETFISDRKDFIEKVSTKLCNHYEVSKLVIPARLLSNEISRQRLLKEILQLVLSKTKINSVCT